jgi:hypothetical protein
MPWKSSAFSAVIEILPACFSPSFCVTHHAQTSCRMGQLLPSAPENLPDRFCF